MTDNVQNQNNRIIYLYRVTCVVNQKVYIGQTVDPASRWRGHRRDSAGPKVPFHHAIKKHGNENFLWEIIASCRSQDDANYLETELVKQYDSYVANEKGYNATHGGMNAPKSEAWFQSMRDWHASMSSEEKAERANKLAKATFNQIATQGHPALGTRRTDEQKANMSYIQQNRELEYTPEIRQRMSEAHVGILDSEETKHNKSISAISAWNKRDEIRFATGEIKCNAPGCDIQGEHHYIILDDIRYCRTHGQRLRRTGFLELQPRTSHNKGGTSAKRTKFTEQQITMILLDNRPLERIAKDFSVTAKVIKRVKLQKK
jgi:group I intron endonuclease